MTVKTLAVANGRYPFAGATAVSRFRQFVELVACPTSHQPNRMPIKLFDKKDDIPEERKADAHETKDGKWAAWEPDDTSTLENTLKTEREKREAAEKLSTKTAAELRKLQDKAKAENAGLTEDKLKELRAEARKEADDEYAERLKDLEDTKRENRTLKLDNQVKKMFADAGFKAGKLDDVWKLHGEEFDLTDDGKPMIKGKPGVDPIKHIEGLKKVRGEWVEGTKAAGGGANGTQTTTTSRGGPTEAQILSNPGNALAVARASGAKE